VPPRGTPEHVRWLERVNRGILAARKRRHEAGLLTLREVSVMTFLPLTAVRRVFPTIEIGQRSYVRAHVVKKWLADTGGDVAA
jgi:hypothetical protein